MTSQAELTFKTVSGPSAQEYATEIADLRITVFREWPYLYDGSRAYELDYLEQYFSCPQSRIVIARLENRIVGASTCLPMVFADEAFQEPFREAPFSLRDIYYFGESVMLPTYRGRGAGGHFMREREAAAHRNGCRIAAFCAVNRPEPHPRRPHNYRPLDSFWERQGFRKRPDLVCRFPWKDLGDTQETEKTLTFWLKSLDSNKRAAKMRF